MFWHIQASSEITQAYSERCVTPAYSEPWYIQNQKPRHIQNPVKYLPLIDLPELLAAIVAFANQSYFYNISFSHFQLFKI